MNTKPDSCNRPWNAPNKRRCAQPIIITKIGLVVLLVAGFGFAAVSQDFQNLDFEAAEVTPPGPSQVAFNSALPGWTGYRGTNLPAYVNYNQEYLDAAGISIFDSNCTIEPVQGLTQGRYCVCLYSGFQGGPPLFEYDVATSIAQTGLVPAYARSILFNFSPSWSWGDQRVNVTFNGTPVPLAVLTTQSNFVVLSGDVSQVAGQIGELRFTAPADFPGRHFRNIFLMDDIGFSTSPSPPLAPAILAPPQSQTTDLGSTIDFVVQAAGGLPLRYQWFFNGTNPISYTTPSGLATSSDLHFVNVQLEQAGAYTVVVSNAFGAVTSSPAILTVTGSPPVILTPPSSQAASVGDIVDFTVSAAGSQPLSYQWLFDSSPISGASGSDLLLVNVLPEQAGAYTVVVSNAFGTVTSSPAILSITGSPQLTSYRVLHSFTGNDGGWPWGGLVSSGQTLYGTTEYGGSVDSGAVFKLNADGSGYTILHNFAGSDGGLPKGTLVLSGATLYGATEGADPGTLFRINTDGSGFILLRQFTGGDGRFPDGGLLLSGSTLYGTTSIGGSAGCGVVFRLNTDGSSFTVLHNFTGYPNDGYGPCGGLVLSGTTLYGATPRGGQGPPTGWPDAGYGTLFKVEVDGSGYTLLKQFDGTNGAGPMGALVLSGTKLYGATQGGVVSPDHGTIFKINTDGSGHTVLHRFAGAPSDGAVPYCGLALSGTTLYGTTISGGGHEYDPSQYNYGDGTIFKVNTDGSGYRLLKEFTGDYGAHPYSGLLLDGGTLYGTASSGGISHNGVVFSLSLSPVIQGPPQSQTAEAGSAVGLWVEAGGSSPLSYLWYLNATNLLSCSTNCELELTNVEFSQSGAYTVVVTNVLGAATSSPALLNVIAPVERRPVPGVKVTGEPTSLLNVDSADSLSPAPSWTTLGSVSLTSTSQYYFDLTLPLPPQRFYRAWQTGAPGVIPSLDLHLIPAITLTGNMGDSWRLDYINQFGPIDAWVTLDTVTLTNTSQLYFDVSVVGQPQRLYRLVPVP